MKSYRLNRLFNSKSNRCFDVAVDHGFFNEYGFLPESKILRRSESARSRRARRNSTDRWSSSTYPISSGAK